MSLIPRGRSLLALLIALLMLAAACGGSSSGDAAQSGDGDEPSPSGDDAAEGTAPGTGGTLNLVRAATDQSLDPATYYGGPANSIEFAIYESLVRTKQGTPTEPAVRELEPWLAESWEVSEGGTVYTFKLRDDVLFHDGTAMDAEAVRYSFQRTIDINDAPAYMLANVASMEVTEPYTLVITLAQPEDGFLDYFTSPYGPKVVSPTLVQANAGDDMGQTFLQTHDAGTGPYTLTALEDGVIYTLEAFDDYWGEAAHYQTVNYRIVPDTTTQLLQFESGDVDAVSYGVSAADLQRLAGDDRYQVDYRPGTAKGYVMLNPNRGITANQDLRLAIAASIDRTALVSSVYQGLAEPSRDFYHLGSLPEGTAPDEDPYDPTVMSALLAEKPEYAQETLILAHGASAIDQQAAETVQIQLQAAGLRVELHEAAAGEVFTYMDDVANAPHMYFGSGTVDTAAPAAWPQTYLLTEAPVNWLGISVPEADEAVMAALASTDEAERHELYAAAAEAFLASGQVITLFDPQSFMLYHKDKIGHYEYDLTNKYDARPETMRP